MNLFERISLFALLAANLGVLLYALFTLRHVLRHFEREWLHHHLGGPHGCPLCHPEQTDALDPETQTSLRQSAQTLSRVSNELSLFSAMVQTWGTAPPSCSEAKTIRDISDAIAKIQQAMTANREASHG